MSCAAVLLVRLAPPLPVLHPGKRGGYKKYETRERSARVRALNRSALCTDVCAVCREKSTGTVQGWAGRYGRFGPLPPTAHP